ncbi:MAG: peptide-methionine (S)-S-oxide reductase MsrA [Flavobacteriales bacterium]|nr:peptide-methionine (S)-S-oxide reductase MsrA [Flavobacteriales bacterium]
MLFCLTACQAHTSPAEETHRDSKKENTTMNANLEEATFGAGCFWCVEAIFQSLEGVVKVESGYSGGTVKNPSYREVCNGTTGHAEVIRLAFDPAVISYAELLEVFWETHDPTTLNRQGADRGTQYRSAIFYHSDEQKRVAELSKAAAEESGIWSDPIVTEISELINYYPAENYHQNYYNDNTNAPYCSAVITPKMDKFRKRFKEKLKAGS